MLLTLKMLKLVKFEVLDFFSQKCEKEQKVFIWRLQLRLLKLEKFKNIIGLFQLKVRKSAKFEVKI